MFNFASHHSCCKLSTTVVLLLVWSAVINEVRCSQPVLYSRCPLCWRQQSRTGGGPASVRSAKFLFDYRRNLYQYWATFLFYQCMVIRCILVTGGGQVCLCFMFVTGTRLDWGKGAEHPSTAVFTAHCSVGRWAQVARTRHAPARECRPSKESLPQSCSVCSSGQGICHMALEMLSTQCSCKSNHIC